MLNDFLRSHLEKSGNKPIVIYRDQFLGHPFQLGVFSYQEAIKMLENDSFENYDVNHEPDRIELFID